MDIDVTVDFVFLCQKSTGKSEVVLLSDIAGGHQAAELWRGNQDAYYNDALRARNLAGKMVHPKVRNDFLVFVGPIWGAPTWSPDDAWELARARVVLPAVTVDET